MTDWDSIKVAYEAGPESIRTIASDHGISASSIVQKAKKLGWQRNGDIGEHVAKKTNALVTLHACEKAEFEMSPRLRSAVQRQVLDRVAAIEKLSTMQSSLLRQLQGYLDHDAKIKHDPREPISAEHYGKAKLAQDVLKAAKAVMVGDMPLIDQAEMGEKEGEDNWVVAIPESEAKRLRGE